MAQPPPVRWLGIDELALRKGHRSYICVLVDLERGCVLAGLAQRTQESLIASFRQKGPAGCAGLEVFSCDMWNGFANTARAVVPHAELGVDRFHGVGQLHQALDASRRALRRTQPDVEALKGIRWLLLRPAADLTLAEKQRLAPAFAACPALEHAGLLKEALREWFDGFDNAAQADRWLSGWMEQALALENRYLTAFVGTLQRWR